ncbi:efflux RND transporter periplasmic adaptor subunit [Salegentibacter sp. JZCK2]|uniref:efflux RND transporter periplasmic adaptor subunit n=1 Tax=Salegentibacter tibetensis TaxID=2873600 RepID=UPI001CCB1251|nr:efflux RND transporter periplasmic adaptor subunit [Salegentibacter tibetensis]MBZ9731103.1 efflux RND transporter periplasmic adaptor subunit [Salegentibacter tibetensis]
MHIISKNSINLLLLLFVLWGLVSCNNTSEGEETANTEENEREGEQAQMEEAMLSQQQFEALDMKIDTLRQRNMAGFVEANGQLEVPPQNEASVTTVIGANVVEISVIEGDEVKEGEILAYISHPDIVQVQTNFLNASNQLNFQEKEFERQQKLYEAGVGSGEVFQRSEAEVQNARGEVQGLRSQLELLNMNPDNILNGTITQRIPVVSPIDGAIEEVNVKTGQFVQSEMPMFEIVNTEHVHADLMVFEKDVSKVKVGQEVNFTVESIPGTQLSATIISISKTFEQDPKAVHVHAEIEDKPENLIPGMYVRGRINVENTQTTALPEIAIAKDGETSYVFTAEKEGEAWSFKPVEVVTGTNTGEWVAVSFLSEVEPGTMFAYKNAYYLMAEMQKGEGGHGH